MLRCSRAALRAAPPVKCPRGFKIEKVLAGVAVNDFVLAQHATATAYAYIGFPGMDALAVAERMLAAPQDQRYLHTVFGRKGVQCDLGMDLDFPFCPVQRGEKGFYDAEAIVIETVTRAMELYKTKLKSTAEIRPYVFTGQAPNKHSFHIHIQAADVCFADYTSAREIASEVNAELATQPIDMGVYRNHGMMRCAFCTKFGEPSRVLVPYRAEDTQLQSLLRPMFDMSEKELFAATLITRKKAATDAQPLRTYSALANKGVVYDERGSAIPNYLREEKKWMRWQEVLSAVKRLPVNTADSYKEWIRIGLALHSFGSGSEIFRVWLNFSARCPGKFKPEVCEKSWAVFGQRPDCHNWRRGYLYICRTLPKELGISTSRSKKGPPGSGMPASGAPAPSGGSGGAPRPAPSRPAGSTRRGRRPSVDASP